MLLRWTVAVLVVAFHLTVPLGRHAQALDLKMTPPSSRERIAPATPERDLYPQRSSVPYQPNFFGPLSKETDSGRAGVAGFTAPNSPVGSRVSGDHDNPGWPGLGIAVEWGRPSARAN